MERPPLCGQATPRTYGSEEDALRITPETVPGTVRELVQAAIRTCSRIAIPTPTPGSKTGGTATAIVGTTSVATGGSGWSTT